MSEPIGERQERTIRMQTAHGAIVGKLLVSPMLRTLDDLNVVARGFVPLQSPELSDVEWVSGDGPLSVNKSCILFAAEVTPMPPRPGGSFGGGFTRGGIRLRVGEFDIRGLVHVPRGGAALTRLTHDTHSFIAITSATVSGPGVELEVPFLAVNLGQILVAEELPDGASELVGVADEGRSEPVGK